MEQHHTPRQARMMMGIAHGWKPTRMKHPPSVKVAKEYVRAKKGSALLRRAAKLKRSRKRY